VTADSDSSGRVQTSPESATAISLPFTVGHSVSPILVDHLAHLQIRENLLYPNSL
jgi:hypothetical protein